MAKLNIKEKYELPELINRLVSRTKCLSVVSNDTPKDIDRKTYAKMCKALKSLDEAIDIVFTNQKARGKVFLSDEAIDKLIDDIKKDVKLS